MSRYGGPIPGWAARRLASDPEGKRCICCEHPIEMTGPYRLRMQDGMPGGLISWCGTCDPWSDAARGMRTVNGHLVYGALKNDSGVCQHVQKDSAKGLSSSR